MIWWIILGLLVLIGLWMISIYNRLIKLRNRVSDQWAQVDVQLKRRSDLVPNLVETVKGYAKHEKETLNAVIEARNKFKKADSQAEEIEASGDLTRALSRLLMLSEAYPDLKANQNFLKLQEDLGEIEEKIAFARQFYNDSVLTYKNKLEIFPSNIVAKMFKFEPRLFFEIDEADKKNPTVSFE